MCKRRTRKHVESNKKSFIILSLVSLSISFVSLPIFSSFFHPFFYLFYSSLFSSCSHFLCYRHLLLHSFNLSPLLFFLYLSSCNRFLSLSSPSCAAPLLSLTPPRSAYVFFPSHDITADRSPCITTPLNYPLRPFFYHL